MEAVVESPARGVARFVVAFFAWASAVSFGLVVTDIGYSRLLRASVDPAVAAPVFGRMADLLLLATAATSIAAFLALAAAWHCKRARVCVLGWLVLGAITVLIGATSPESLAALGPGLRLWLSGGASVLAMLSLHEMRRSG